MAAGHGGLVLVAESTAVLLSGVDLIDLGPRRLRDVPTPLGIFQVRAPGLATDFPALRALDTSPGNLRAPATSFIGRETEVAVVTEALHQHRLVTLTGVGGVRKTRLATEVAARLADEFPDGVWFFELAAVTDPAAMPDAQPVDPRPAGPTPGQSIDTVSDTALGAVDRLDEIPGIGPNAARVILAEIGLDMSRFPTPAHLVSWAKLCPRTIQSGPLTRGGKTGKGNPYLKGTLGDAAAAAAAAAAKTNTFLGERYRRIVKRRGKLKALVAVARSILVIVWHLLTDSAARFHDLGSDYHTRRIDLERRMRNHIAQLTAMGYRVTLEPAA
jgi:hypothetical protein